ncbi:MAG: hypothetical protein HY606_06675 [Planctomycetes bacterium]|nr:hypothetical protein [Planctomycetota bacterium]
MSEFTQLTRLPDNATAKLNPRSMIQNLLADHETTIINNRNDIRTLQQSSSPDEGTIDFLTALNGAV